VHDAAAVQVGHALRDIQQTADLALLQAAAAPSKNAAGVICHTSQTSQAAYWLSCMQQQQNMPAGNAADTAGVICLLAGDLAHLPPSRRSGSPASSSSSSIRQQQEL
jgi:hypothetical protein